MNVKILVAGIAVACVVVAGVGAYFILKGPEGAPPEGGEEGEEAPGSPPLYGGATYAGTDEILSVQGASYTVPAHSAEVYSYYIEQMPSLGWTEVSRKGGILYFEKGDYGAAIKATEGVGPQTRLVIGYASKAEFELIEEENVLPPTDYQTTFPCPTDIFISDFTDYSDPEVHSQTHATIVGSCHQPIIPEREDYYFHQDYYHSTVEAAHEAGLKYTARTTPDPGLPIEFLQSLNGECIDIDGQKIYQFMPPWGRPLGCLNNPAWKELVEEYTKRCSEGGPDVIVIDGVLAHYDTLHEPFNGCFCEYCMQGFREYLKGKYSAEEFEDFNIENIDNFDYGDFIRERYLTTYEECRGDVPFFSDFQDYQMTSVKKFWRDLINEIRASAHGKDIYFTANIGEMWPDFLAMQDELDFLQPEYIFAYPPQGRSIPFYKLARSLGKPAAVTPSAVAASAELMARHDVTALMKIYTAEAYSARGFLYVPYAQLICGPEGWTVYSANMGELKPYYDFIRNNEACYENLFSASKVAVLYSFPSVKRRSIGIDEFYGISNLLLNSHFQYDVLFAGDNNWVKDNYLSLGALNKYEVVILHNTRCLSDRQVDLLLSYVEMGGNILAFSEIGFYDENENPVERKLLESLLVEGSHDFGLGKFIYSRDLPTREEVGEILSGLIQPCIQTNANENVVMLEYWNSGARSIVIHLINYAYDIETEHLSSQENINLKVTLDPELLGKDLNVSYMSPDWAGIEELSYTLSDGSVEFQIPNLEFYGVVSVEEASD